MPTDPATNGASRPRAASRWSTLYGLGALSAVLVAGLVLLAVLLWPLWPHVFGVLDAEAVLAGIQRAPVELLFRLDPVVLWATVAQVPLFLALWAALRAVDEGWALFALAVGAVAVAAVMPTRPILELYTLSDLHAAAPPGERHVYVAAAEALLAQFHGAAWATSIFCGGTAGLTWSVLMLRSADFRALTAWVGIAGGAGSMIFFVPGIGILSLFLLGTVGAVIWLLLVAADLFALWRRTRQP
ncbi:MAG: hypothetical protein ACFCGT_04855 [Sandaracinaceae bacterium]